MCGEIDSYHLAVPTFTDSSMLPAVMSALRRSRALLRQPRYFNTHVRSLEDRKLHWLLVAAVLLSANAQASSEALPKVPEISAATSSAETKTITLVSADRVALRARLGQLRQQAERPRGAQENREAQIEEAIVLSRLAGDGNAAEKQQRYKLVAELVSDPAIPRTKRLEVAATSANADVFADRTLSRSERMSRFAEVAWRLARDFPDEPESYEALLRIAANSGDTAARQIANDLLASKGPESVKAGARTLLSRLDLIGKPLSAFLPAEIAAHIQPGQAVCLFTWTSKHPKSLAIAAMLKERLPAGTFLVGICVDDDIVTARNYAAQRVTPAELLYDTQGVNSALAIRLGLVRPGQVYLTNPDGRISTISGLDQLPKRVRAPSHEQSQ